MNNDQMTAGRFLRWAKARARIAAIQNHLRDGGEVQLITCTRYTVFKPKHVDMFKATKTGAFVQRGKRWDCIDFTHSRLI